MHGTKIKKINILRIRSSHPERLHQLGGQKKEVSVAESSVYLECQQNGTFGESV